MSCTLRDLAAHLGARLAGNGDRVIASVGSLASAGPDQVAFLADRRFRGLLRKTRAGAVILAPDDAGEFDGDALVTDNPHAGYARAAAFLHPAPAVAPGVHGTAVVHASAQVDGSAEVGALAVIEADARIGPGVSVGTGCWIGRGATVGAGSRLHANVAVYPDSVIGRRCVVLAGAVIGSDGFGFAREQGHWLSIPQLGRAVLGDDVSVGANTTIDRGALGDTVIGDGVKLDNQIHIAHNVRVGRDTIMAACVGVAGSSTIGERCMLAGGVGIADHVSIADDVTVTGFSMVTRAIERPGTYSSGWAVQEAGAWRRQVAGVRRLAELGQRVKRLEDGSTDGSEREDV